MASSQKVALITAAGSGMGAAIARRFAQSGYSIAVLSSSGKGQALAEELGGFGFTGSNRNVQDLQDFVNGALERFGRIDCVVNSAGHGPKGSITVISDEEWVAGMEVYLLNVIRMARLVTPVFEKQRGRGTIINISTFAAPEPNATFPTSSVFRAGLASYTKLYSTEYAGKNIRMNNILPGFIDSLPQNEAFLKEIPMERYGTVEEIAGTALFLASEDAAYITGQNIRVDGGITKSIF